MLESGLSKAARKNRSLDFVMRDFAMSDVALRDFTLRLKKPKPKPIAMLRSE
jgi:hypothetical protein